MVLLPGLPSECPPVDYSMNHLASRDALLSEGDETNCHYKLVVVVSMQLLLDALSTTRQFVQGVEASALVKAVRTPDSALMFVCLAVTTCLCLIIVLFRGCYILAPLQTHYSVQSVMHIYNIDTASLAGIQVI